MFFETYLTNFKDGLFAKFTSERMQVRGIRRDIRGEGRIERRVGKDLKTLAEDLKSMRTAKVAHDIEKGYYVLLDKEMDRLFDALNRIIVLYKQLVADMDEQLKTAVTLIDEQYKLAMDRKRTDEERAAALQAVAEGQHTVELLNQDLDILQDGLNAFLQQIVGMASLTVSAQKLLGRASLEADLQYKARVMLKQVRKYKHDRKLSEKDLKKLVREVKSTKKLQLKEDLKRNEPKMQDDIKTMVTGINQITSEMIIDIQFVQKEIENLLSEKGKGMKLGDIRPDNLPSVKTLTDPRAAVSPDGERRTPLGGFGYPQDEGKKLIEEANTLKRKFDDKIVDIIKLARQELSQPVRFKRKVRNAFEEVKTRAEGAFADAASKLNAKDMSRTK